MSRENVGAFSVSFSDRRRVRLLPRRLSDRWGERERKRRRLDVHDRVQMWAIFESCMNRAHTPSSSLVPVECGHGGGRYHRGLFRIPARVIRMPWHRFPVVSVLPQSRSVSRARALDSRVVSYLFCHRSFELARIREWQVSYGYSKAILSRSMSSALS